MDGKEDIKLKAIQILYSSIKGLLYSLTAVFGMDTIVEILVQQPIKNIGKRRENGILNTIKRLLPDLSLAVGP